jgi:hypothetical protein
LESPRSTCYKGDVPRNWDAYYSDPAHLNPDPAPLLVQAIDFICRMRQISR